MSLTKEQKQHNIDLYSSIAESSSSVVCLNYRGISAVQMSELRESAIKLEVGVKVVSNNLAKKAFVGTKFNLLSDYLVGPILLLHSDEDVGAGARLVKDVHLSILELPVVAMSLGEEVLFEDSLKQVASLPTYSEAIAKLLMVLKAPATKAVSTVEAVSLKLVRTVKAVSEKKKTNILFN